MKTDIEKMILSRRDHLDADNPPDVWPDVRARWQPPRKKSWHQYWQVAAAIAVAFVIGAVLYSQDLWDDVERLATLGDISYEYKELERNYEAEIKQISSKLPMDDIKQDEELAWLLDELEALEEVNKEYRADIRANADREQLIRVLTDYYEKKIRLLRALEYEMNRQKNEPSDL
jgi:hypothetical protein